MNVIVMNVMNNSDALQILKDENTELMNKVESFKKECNLLLGRVRSLESTHEDLDGKVRNSKLILEKAEETIKTKSELIDAKNEIIDNLKIRIKGDATTIKTIQVTEDKMVQSENEKYGVKDCCEYLSIHEVVRATYILFFIHRHHNKSQMFAATIYYL